MRFRIQSTQTDYFLISNGQESEGSVVATVPENEYNPSTTVRILVHDLDKLLTMVAGQIVSIEPSIFGPLPVVAVVQSIRVPGLYVGYKSVGLSSAPLIESRLTRALG